MREKLAVFNGQRKRFTATFVRFGKKRGWKGKEEQTVLFQDVRDEEGNVVADHVWMNCGRSSDFSCLNPGDAVSFCARVKPYEKGYYGYRRDVFKPGGVDFKLSHPSMIHIVHSENDENP